MGLNPSGVTNEKFHIFWDAETPIYMVYGLFDKLYFLLSVRIIWEKRFQQNEYSFFEIVVAFR